jgi:DNA-directed RNA polymerase subunit E'/Rpb7
MDAVVTKRQAIKANNQAVLRKFSYGARSGLTLDLGFSQDVFVPEQYMQTPGSSFDEAAGRWQWQYEEEQMPLDAGAVVRFKVREVSFPRLDDAAVAAPADGASTCNTGTLRAEQLTEYSFYAWLCGCNCLI